MINMILILKGFCIGIANLIPGVSGGTMALILGIYEKLIFSLKKLDLKFLFPLGAGAGLAILSGAKLVPHLLDTYPEYTFALFLGLIVASLKVPYRKIERKGSREAIVAILSFILAFYIAGLESRTVFSGNKLILVAGFFGMTAMLLPGISGSAILLILGAYRPVLKTISSFDFTTILPFGLGLLLGVIFFVLVFSFLLKRYHSLSMAFLVGLMMGSLRAIIPNKFNICILFFFALGVGAIFMLERTAFKRKTNSLFGV